MILKKKPEEHPKLNEETNDSMQMAKAGIRRQAGLAVISIIIVLVLIFGMSVAWYSNVIHNEGLSFETASWDFEFEGNISIDSSIKAAPGKSGIVELTLKNDSDEAINVVTNVSRELFPEEMKKRIYFYADTSESVNGEIVDRVYVNEIDEYIYTVAAKNTLILGQDYANAPLLKWEWIYDVLGYYVQGTVTSGGADIDEYLRPIAYDYEKATFTEPASESEAAQLLTVDGETSVQEFLAQLSETDGYSSDINYAGKVNGYYPVSVDANGYGTWVYLCNKSEILFANQYDTYLGEQAAEGSASTYTARLLLTGQQKNEAETTVSTAADFATALADTTVDRICLSGDLTITDELAVAAGRSVTVDLNGNTLYTSEAEESFSAESGSELTIINGSIESTDKTKKAYVVGAYGSKVTLSNVTMTDVYTAVYVHDNDDTAQSADSWVFIENCTLNTYDVTLFIRGNATDSGRKSTVVINNSTLISEDYVAIMGNGSPDSWGTDITINKSTIEGKWAAIYQPQSQSTVNITDSTLSGYTAVVIKAGTANVQSSVLLGTGAKQAAGFAVSGFTDTGDALYVETNYETEISVNVSGESYLKSDYGYAIQVYDPDAEHASVIVTEGHFSSDVSSFLPADGSCVMTDSADAMYPYTVGAKPASE